MHFGVVSSISSMYESKGFFLQNIKNMDNRLISFQRQKRLNQC